MEGESADHVTLYSSPQDPLTAHTGAEGENTTLAGTNAHARPIARVPVMPLEQLLERHPMLRRGPNPWDAGPDPNVFRKWHRGIGMVKIDVEGAEIEVLRSSGHRLLADMADVLFIDLHPESLVARGESAFDLYKWLQYRGYWILMMQGTVTTAICVHERVWPFDDRWDSIEQCYQELHNIIKHAYIPGNNLKVWMSRVAGQKVGPMRV